MYQIEILDEYGIWQTDLVGDGNANRYSTEEEAEQDIIAIRLLGDEWRDSKYRVVEID